MMIKQPKTKSRETYQTLANNDVCVKLGIFMQWASQNGSTIACGWAADQSSLALPIALPMSMEGQREIERHVITHS